MKRVCIVGADVSGLITALFTAQTGFSTCLSHDEETVIEALNTRTYTTSSPEINEALQSEIVQSHLTFATDIVAADFFIVTATQKRLPLTQYLSLISKKVYSVGSQLKKGDVVIIAAPVPLGTTLSLIDILTAESGLTADQDFFVAYCPERIVPSKLFQDIKVYDRVIGARTTLSGQKAAQFYQQFVSGDLYVTDLATAELTKLVEDGYQDLMTAFSHHVTQLAHSNKVNPYEIIELANKHPRIHLESPSCGESVYSIMTQPALLINSASSGTELLKTAQTVLEKIPQDIEQIVSKTIQATQERIKRCNIVVIGLSTNPQCSYTSCSSTEPIVHTLLKRADISLKIVDPFSEHRTFLKDLLTPLEEGIAWADVVIGLVAHDEFRTLNKTLLKNKTVLDLCGMFYEQHVLSRTQEQLFWPASKLSSESLTIPNQTIHRKTEPEGTFS